MTTWEQEHWCSSGRSPLSVQSCLKPVTVSLWREIKMATRLLGKLRGFNRQKQVLHRRFFVLFCNRSRLFPSSSSHVQWVDWHWQGLVTKPGYCAADSNLAKRYLLWLLVWFEIQQKRNFDHDSREVTGRWMMNTLQTNDRVYRAEIGAGVLYTDPVAVSRGVYANNQVKDRNENYEISESWTLNVGPRDC